MALSNPRPVSEVTIMSFSAIAGTPGGTRMNVPSPVRGRVMECGFMPNSLVASAMTLAVAIGDQISSTASNFTQIVTSTLGTFSSDNLFEGAIASVIPPSASYVEQGDAIQFTASGGNTSAIGATFYAIIRRAGV